MAFILNAIDLSVIFYFSLFMMANVAYALAGQKINYRKVLCLEIVPAIAMSVLCYALLSIGEFFKGTAMYYAYRIVNFSIETAVQLSWIYLLFRTMEKKKLFFIASTVFIYSFINDSIMMSLLSVARSVTADSNVMILKGLFNFLVVIFSVLAIIVALRCVSKTKFWHNFQAFGEYPKLYIPMGTAYLVFFVFSAAFGLEVMSVQWLILSISLAYLVLIGLVSFIDQ